MASEALSRKYRPRTFEDMTGQEHVLRALAHALDHGRLHHAYLFTGTRGVGKTTVARILARCLNCETGVGASPCGTCASCTEISEGRFIDLLEIDAASRTRVEDTRDLLENVQYAPARGRYKVYLIDEVHMLSLASFNALLKTLEEPPPHVVFLLATTDPRKLPVTVLSRCLQFHLRNLLPEQIERRLADVLDREGIQGEPGALRLIARAAQGSMRDAESLADQAIAFGEGAVLEAPVARMLGTVRNDSLAGLLASVASGQGAAALAMADELAVIGADFGAVLDDFAALLHAIATFQVVPDAPAVGAVDAAVAKDFAERIGPETIQLLYQICITGRRDLPLAPDAKVGFEMCLLRMLAFAPLDEDVVLPPGPASMPVRPAHDGMSGSDASDANRAAPAIHRGDPREAASGSVARDTGATAGATAGPIPERRTESDSGTGRGTVRGIPTDDPDGSTAAAPTSARDAARSGGTDPILTEHPGASTATGPHEHASIESATARWDGLLETLGLNGVLGSLAAQCVLVRVDTAASPEEWLLRLDDRHTALLGGHHPAQLAQHVSAHVGHPVRVRIETGSVSVATPAARRAERARVAREAALRALESDETVELLIRRFDARIDPDTVRATGLHAPDH